MTDFNFDFTGKVMPPPPDIPKNLRNPYLKENAGFLTASKLKRFAECPYSYYLENELGLELEDTDKVYFQMGNAIDDYVTYGREYYDSKYKYLAYKQRKSHPEGIVEFSCSEGHTLDLMIEELKRQPLFELHNPRFKCQKEIIAEFEGVKLRAKLDRIDPKGFEIRDTKTCRHADNGKTFYNNVMFSIHDFGYIFSMAFYSGLANIAKSGEWKVLLEFVSKGTDHAKFLQIEIPPEVLHEKQLEIFGHDGQGGLIRFYKLCKQHNYFPTHAELSPFNYSYLNSPFYKHNPGSVQKEPLTYQEFTTSHYV